MKSNNTLNELINLYYIYINEINMTTTICVCFRNVKPLKYEELGP